MNGYGMTVESYKELLGSNRTDMDKEFLKAEIKALEPFVERTEEEIIRMFDSGAFNGVLKKYCEVAMKNCGFEYEEISRVLAEIGCLLDEIRANEIIKK